MDSDQDTGSHKNLRHEKDQQRFKQDIGGDRDLILSMLLLESLEDE